MKSLKEISWQVTEPEYRADDALSYSTLAKFAREGFDKLGSLFDKVETPSLTFGSAVDALITGGQEEFDKNFLVANFPAIKDSVEKVVKSLFASYGTTCRTINDIKEADVITATEVNGFQLNWRPETRAKAIREQGFEYYNLMFLAKDKKIISEELKQKIDSAVEALRTSEATKFYFEPNNPFNKDIERFYQLKFKANINGIDFRCMADEIVVDHKNKVIHPVDLKTSSHTEWEFYKSFAQWRYDIQARLYWKIIRDNLDRDPVYKEYELSDYTFIVVNKETLTPLKWVYNDTKKEGTIVYGNNFKCQDPVEIAQELKYYLEQNPSVPIGIDKAGANYIEMYLND